MVEAARQETSLPGLRDCLRLGECRGVKLPIPDPRPTQQILRGRNAFVTIRDGLTLHYSDSEALEDFQVDVECGPQLTIGLYLKGATDASIGRFHFPMPHVDPGGGGWHPVGTLLAQSEPERFVRKARKGERFRKVTVSISPAWLESARHCGKEDMAAIRRFAGTHMASRVWVPSQRAMARALQIIHAPDMPLYLRGLYLESRVLELVVEAFEGCFPTSGSQGSEALRPLDLQRLERVEAYLERSPQGPTTIEVLAQQARTSPNTLQRLFHSRYGMSVHHFVRAKRLHQARRAMEKDGASIGEASYIAGYSNPANFSTAFKKHFGLSPSELQFVR